MDLLLCLMPNLWSKHHSCGSVLLSTSVYKMLLLQVKASTPVLLCSVPGFDASGRVDDMAAELNKQITSIAIG